MKVGYVSIIGKPNVGKSTLMNAIFNKKISIVTDKSQTTRNTINYVYEDDDSQIIFVDTPGIHKPVKKLGAVMNKESYDTIRGADVTIFMLDAGHNFNDQDQYLFDHLKFDGAVIAAFNKIDTTNILLINSLKEKVKQTYPKAEIIEISALQKFNVDELLDKIKTYLPDGEKVEFPKEDNLAFIISEVVRERALNILQEEVPHSIYVRIDNLEKKGKMIDCSGSIFVEKDSQKAIVIGTKGSMIKRIGTASRVELEKIYHTHVNIHLVVKVNKDWRDNMKSISSFGFGK